MLKIRPSPLTPMAESPHEQFLSHLTQSSRLNPLRNGKCLQEIISQAVILDGGGGGGTLESTGWWGCFLQRTPALGILQEVGGKACLAKESLT